jgi:hypothetical protein
VIARVAVGAAEALRLKIQDEIDGLDMGDEPNYEDLLADTPKDEYADDD